jgi:peroxiredoxin
MKKLTLIAVSAIFMANCSKADTYTVAGNIDGLEGTVYLFDGQGDRHGEAAVNNGRFTIRGKVEEPGIYYIGNDNEQFTMLILENARINVNGNIDNPGSIQVSGTLSNDRLTEFSGKRETLVEQFYTTEDDDVRSKILEEDRQMIEDAIDSNLDNYFGLYMISEAVEGWESDRVLAKLGELAPELQNTSLGRELKGQAEAKKRIEVGQPNIEVTLPDREGNELSLSSYIGEGKYVLLDFWASWCGPCIKEMPYLRDTYEKYHGKGFEIFGVSVDSDPKAWLEAVDSNGMAWVQVYTSAAAGNKAATDYLVRTIPSNFLLGPDGTIIAKNLRGAEVEKKVAELLGK